MIFQKLDPRSWTQGRFETILQQLSGKKIIVWGDVGIDRYTLGSVERISPEAPVPIVWVKEEKLKLGLAANVADNVRALGGIPQLFGVIGSDRNGEDLRSLLQQASIEDRYLVETRSRRTVLKERIVGENQQMLRIDYENVGPIENQVTDLLFARFLDCLPEAEGVIIEDYAKGLLTVDLTMRIIDAAQAAGKPVAIDPHHSTPITHYRHATLLTPNTKEAEKLSGITISDRTSLEKAGRKILEITSAESVIITRGKEGMALFQAKKPEIQWIPTYAQEVYDVSGAGDTVIATLTLALTTGATLEEAALISNLAAGVEVSKFGTATVCADEIRHAFLQTRLS